MVLLYTISLLEFVGKYARAKKCEFLARQTNCSDLDEAIELYEIDLFACRSNLLFIARSVFPRRSCHYGELLTFKEFMINESRGSRVEFRAKALTRGTIPNSGVRDRMEVSATIGRG